MLCLTIEKKILAVLLICFPFSIGFVFVQNKYTHSRPMHLSTNTDNTLYTDSNAAFLFTLPLSFPLDIFAHCHLWNTVETQRDVSWACLALQAVGSLIKDGGTAWSPLPFFRLMLLVGSVRPSSTVYAGWFLQMLFSLDFIVGVSTRTLKLLLKVPAAAASMYGEGI